MPGSANLAQTIRAYGTEPFWALDVRADSASYTDFSVADPRPVALANLRSTVGDRETVVRGSLPDGRPVVLTLTPESCSEAGEQTSPMTARLQVGDAARTGCAGPIPGDGFR